MTVTGDAVAGGRALDGRALGIPPAAYRPPRFRPGLIRRKHLVEQLLDSCEQSVVTVCAPAGYGKTTTILLWDEADDRDFLWVHLDAKADDAAHLVLQTALAFDDGIPIDAHTARVLTGPGRSIETDLLPALGRVLSDRGPFVLVLDDVHHVRSEAGARVVEALGAHLPAGSQLVLSGRALPPVPVARRRMSDELVEIAAGDLAMDGAEALAVLRAAGADVDEPTAEELVEQTEGWPGGLHLAALALTRPDRAAGARFSGRDRLVADYLVEEVLGSLRPETVEFLTRSALLDQMSAALLDDLLATDTSARLLDEVERSGNLFLVPLDNEREWFRYHHLFADVLRVRLRTAEPAVAAELDRRASALLEQRGDADGAIRHAVAAGDLERAADLILVHGQRVAFEGRAPRLRQWLDLLGEGAVDRQPAAAVACAWYGVATGDATRLRRGLAAATGVSGPMADGSPSAAISAAMVRAMAAEAGLAGVLRETEAVREAGNADTNSLWALATVVQGTAYSMMGQHDIARDRLTSALPALAQPAFRASALAHLALLDLEGGDPIGAERNSERALQITDRHNLETVLPTIAVFPVGAVIAARRGRREEAATLATITERLLARLGDLSPRSAVLGYTLLAEAAVAGGDRARARLLLDEARRARQREPGATFLNQKMDALELDLATTSRDPVLGVTPLTPAELRVLAYLPTHLSLQEIADQLIISRNTAKSHSVAIYRKLGVASRSDAVAEARRLGLLDA